MLTFLLVEPVPENVDPDLDPDPRHRSIKGNNFEGEKNHNCLNNFRIGPKLGLNTRGPGMFPVPDWNHFEDIISGLAQTNNTSEGKKFFYYILWIIEVECRCPCWRVHVRTRICLVGPGCPFVLKMFLICGFCGCGQDAEMNLA